MEHFKIWKYCAYLHIWTYIQIYIKKIYFSYKVKYSTCQEIVTSLCVIKKKTRHNLYCLDKGINPIYTCTRIGIMTKKIYTYSVRTYASPMKLPHSSKYLSVTCRSWHIGECNSHCDRLNRSVVILRSHSGLISQQFGQVNVILLFVFAWVGSIYPMSNLHSGA